MVRDDDGDDNISDKNRYFCELTAAYWIWKHAKAEYVGMFHYRRFFNFKNDHTVFHRLKDSFLGKYDITQEKIMEILKDYDVILSCKMLHFKRKMSLYEAYNKCHNVNDLEKMLDIVNRKYPQIGKTARKTLTEQYTGYGANMMVCRKALFDEYYSFVFDVLFELEKEIQPEVATRSRYQQRTYGFLAERLTNIFFEYKKQADGIKVKEVPILYWEESPWKWCKYKFKRVWKKVGKSNEQ